VDTKKYDINKILELQMKDYHFENVLKSYIPYWVIFQQDIQKKFINFYHSL
jgi:hypothetical protein